MLKKCMVLLLVCLFISVPANSAFAAKKTEQTIRIGFIGSFSGSIDSAFARSVYNGFDMALNRVHYKAGSYSIEVVCEDDQNVPALSAAAAQKLINEDKVNVLIGPLTSACAQEVVGIAQTSGVPMIMPCASNPGLTVDSNGARNDFVFRTCFTDTYEGQMAAQFAVDQLKAATAVVLYEEGNAYAELLTSAFQSNFQGDAACFAYSGVEITPDLINQIGQPDVIYLPGFDVSDIAGQIKNHNIQSAIIGCEGWQFTETTLPLALDGSYYTHFFASDNPGAQNWVRKYEAVYPESRANVWAATGYDTGLTLVAAIKNAGSIQASDIRDAIQGITNLDAVCGPITIGPDGNPVDKDVTILRINGTIPEYFLTIHP